MVVKRKHRSTGISAIIGCLLQTVANLGDCPPKAEVRGSNPFGRATGWLAACAALVTSSLTQEQQFYRYYAALGWIKTFQL
jgi:hypothetical protein